MQKPVMESDVVQSDSRRDELQLQGGDTLNKGRRTSSEQQSVVKPQQPGRKSFRYLSFRKKIKVQAVEATTTTPGQTTEKPLRRISFKTVALSIQKWLIRVSVPRSPSTYNERTTISSVESKQEAEASNDNNTSNEDEKASPVASTPKPNWNTVFSGIQNHGNTCFLNAVIQCLSHTDLLAKYIVLDTYKQDLCCQNSTTAEVCPKKSEVTERLAVLIKSLWTSRYSAEISSGFKTVVGKHGEQYKGTLQHDAQEFLLWLLDAVHEDVNRSRKGKEVKSSVVQAVDKTIDYSAILSYTSNNQSFILDVFQAVLRSSLTCPRCGKQSVTFDPYLSLSIPIPQRTTCPVWLTYIRPNTQKRHIRIAVSISLRYRVVDVLHEVAQLMSVPMETLVLTEMYSEGFRRTFSGNESVSTIQNAQNMYIFELSGYNHFEKPTLLMQSLFPRLPTIAILVVNCEIQSNGHLKRFGTPYSVRVLKELSYLHLQEAIFKANTNVRCAQQDGNVFGLRVCTSGHFGTGCHLTPEVDHPLYQNIVEESLKSSNDKAGLCHVKMIAEWSKESRERYFNFDPTEKLYEMHPSVAEVEKLYAKPWSVTIDECLKLYTQEEQLSGDAWLCPNCQHEQQGAMKQLHLHTVPDVLIIHLKRFRQLKTSRSKLHVMVNFPVEGLDMSPYMDIQQQFKDDPPVIAGSRSLDHVYDLYAVCNHLGTMCVGHYTATCKNPVDGYWYSYDDFHVDRIPEKDIVTNAAYLLFYVRRSNGQRLTGSTFQDSSSVSPDHWVFNVPKELLSSSQAVIANGECDSKIIEQKKVLDSSPKLAEHYVARKFQSDTYYGNTSRQELPGTYRVMSESCV